MTRPDVHEMVVVHRAFRREFGAAAGHVRRTRAGDTRRARIVAEHLRLAFAGLEMRRPASSRRCRRSGWVAGIEDPEFTVTTPLAWVFYAVGFGAAVLAGRTGRAAQLSVLAYLVALLCVAVF